MTEATLEAKTEAAWDALFAGIHAGMKSSHYFSKCLIRNLAEWPETTEQAYQNYAEIHGHLPDTVPEKKQALMSWMWGRLVNEGLVVE